MQLFTKDVDLAEAKWKKEKPLIKRKLQLKQEKEEFYNQYAGKKKMSTSKMLILFLFINCTIIEIFTGWVTVQSLILSQTTMVNPDFTPLVTLIGAIVSEVIGFAIYSLKSAKENTVGGIVFEQAMASLKADGQELFNPDSVNTESKG